MPLINKTGYFTILDKIMPKITRKSKKKLTILLQKTINYRHQFCDYTRLTGMRILKDVL